MDAFIKSFSSLADELMPILGAVALVCVIILLIKLIKIFGGFNTTVDKANKTIDLVDETIEKAQAPLDTVVKVSHTIDKAHDATVAAVDAVKDMAVKAVKEVKNKVDDYIDSED